MISIATTTSRILEHLSNIARWLSAIGLVLMTILVAWQVFARYVLNDTPTWTETSALLLMAWFIFLGAAIGVRESNHLGFDILLHVIPHSASKFMRTISDLVVCAFGGGMVIYGAQLTAGTWTATLPALGCPGSDVYIPLL